MMCTCDEDFARRFLPHQIDLAVVLETQERVPVTQGFQKGICRGCRGMQEEAHPSAQIYGRTSKVVRYYWREIFYETTARFERWAVDNGYDNRLKAQQDHPDEHRRIEKEVINEIKQQHKKKPKYEYAEESQAEIIRKYRVEIVSLQASYIKGPRRDLRLLCDGKQYGLNEFVTRHFEYEGFQVLFTESRPLHVLFSIYMWALIQDPGDPLNRLCGFGSRTAYEENRVGELISIYLPQDFGTPAYASRRARAIDDHLDLLKDDVIWLFDHWLTPSSDLRQYLWAHKESDVATARRLISILPRDVIVRIVKYLIGAYWERYIGWPDILVYNNDNFFFAEVKSSRDRLSENQKRWIRDNACELLLPFKLIKIHRRGTVELT